MTRILLRAILIGAFVFAQTATALAAEPVKFDSPNVKLYSDQDCFDVQVTVSTAKLPPLFVDESVRPNAGCITLKDASGKPYFVMKASTRPPCSLAMRSPDRPSSAFTAGSRGANC